MAKPSLQKLEPQPDFPEISQAPPAQSQIQTPGASPWGVGAGDTLHEVHEVRMT